MKKLKFFTLLCFSAAIVFGVATAGLQYYGCKGIGECAVVALLFGIAAEFLGNI
ncbi:MAG: hypothetical protein V1711_01780 [bacterium]